MLEKNDMTDTHDIEYAVQHADYEMIDRFLGETQKGFHTSGNRVDLVVKAIVEKQDSVALYLIDKLPVSVNDKGSERISPGGAAAMHDRERLFDALIDRGFSLAFETARPCDVGRTALTLAARFASGAMTNRVLETGALDLISETEWNRIIGEAVMSAVTNSNKDGLAAVIPYIQDPNQLCRPDAPESGRHTVLYWVSDRGDSEDFRILLDNAVFSADLTDRAGDFIKRSHASIPSMTPSAPEAEKARAQNKRKRDICLEKAASRRHFLDAATVMRQAAVISDIATLDRMAELGWDMATIDRENGYPVLKTALQNASGDFVDTYLCRFNVDLVSAEPFEVVDNTHFNGAHFDAVSYVQHFNIHDDVAEIAQRHREALRSSRITTNTGDNPATVKTPRPF